MIALVKVVISLDTGSGVALPPAAAHMLSRWGGQHAGGHIALIRLFDSPRLKQKIKRTAFKAVLFIFLFTPNKKADDIVISYSCSNTYQFALLQEPQSYSQKDINHF